ncbi:HeH/LEM domain-containing protein [Clostridium tertium]|uniref:HeH/LEM domain-containing protein n=1 Tax=Clostridium tertium TaxID=1559 RepID=A0A9X3XQR5_9CLOT|nr:HeH/LEM domain-containing protein [Clostridium tertium]MDC4242429.1 HeH/LEM domain-containing protein [Clostridium tertium]
MSVTAFQRRRRELKAKEKQLREDNSLEEKEDLKSLKNDELKKLLDEKGIEYDSKAKKEELIKLLEGAE